jgi:H+/Cl- antiporter ClcA
MRIASLLSWYLGRSRAQHERSWESSSDESRLLAAGLGPAAFFAATVLILIVSVVLVTVIRNS